MTLLLISFVAGILTILAPCILPVLPIVLGRSVEGSSKLKPLIISLSLAVSVVVFTLALKASTVFIDIPQNTWSYVSGGIIIIFGIISLFPGIWEKFAGLFKFSIKSNQALGKSSQKKGIWGDILVGASLGPVFSSCSPTYFLLIATVLPQSYTKGVLYISVYALGLSLMLLLIGYIGQRFAKRLTSFADPKGWFKKGLGILFLIVGLAMITGYDKKLEAKLLDTGFIDVTKIEQRLLESEMDDMEQEGVNINEDKQNQMNKEQFFGKFNEIVNPSGFVNTEGISIGDLVGDKVILVDFWTYSCINCQRTFPYLRAWYEKYKDAGLEIVAIHTPEFAFEKKIENVEQAAKDFGLEYPIVLDNDYSTWRAYKNNYWPRKYLIDVDGFIIYDHIGEGGYEETERNIQKALQELKERQDMTHSIDTSVTQVSADRSQARSPETYFGSLRNKNLGNGSANISGEQNLTFPDKIKSNVLYLEGKWDIQSEYASNIESVAKVKFRYNADKVFIVAEADKPVSVKVLRDGKEVDTLVVQESILYQLIDEDTPGEHVLELIVEDVGVRFYAFTFG